MSEVHNEIVRPTPDPLKSERYLKEILGSVSHEQLGQRLRDHRKNSGLSIRQLSAMAMVSKTSIVTLEQGKGCRPVTLEKVCRALNLHVERLAKPEIVALSKVHRQADDEWYELDGLVNGPIEGRVSEPGLAETNHLMMFQNIPSNAGFISGIVEIDSPTELRSHPGAEFGYVLSGFAKVKIGAESLEVQEGETFYVSDGEVHAYSPSIVGASARILLFRLT